jgi:hypothetical protein
VSSFTRSAWLSLLNAAGAARLSVKTARVRIVEFCSALD